MTSNEGTLDQRELFENSLVTLNVLSGIGKSLMPQVYLEIFADVPSFRQSAVGKWFATVMLTREGAGHRLIIGIGPKTADLASPLKAGNFEAIFAESLQHGQPAGAWYSSASRLSVTPIRPPLPAPITATVCAPILFANSRKLRVVLRLMGCCSHLDEIDGAQLILRTLQGM